MQPTKTTTLLHQTEKFGYFCIINIRKTIQDRNKSKEKCNSQKGLLLGLYLLLFTFNSFGQGELYNAKVSIFTKSEYSAGTQNWDIERDNMGRLFIANNEGLLIYNGVTWELHPVPNKTIVRSIAMSNDGRLYVGAQDEFGYFKPDITGKFIFTSLKKQLPPSVSSFADVWNIEIIDQDVFFMTPQFIFRYSNNSISYFKPKTTWTSLKKHHNKLITQDKKSGILLYNNGRWEPLINQSLLPNGFQITDIKPFGKDTSLVSTTGNGLYLLTQNQILPFKINALINEDHFTTIEVLDGNHFLLGSYNSGLYKIDKKGNIQGNISSKQGLVSNTIRCLYSGFDGCTWIGMDNSIALIDWGNSIYHINPNSFNNGSGHGAISLNGDLYFALSTGLQSIDIRQKNELGSLSLKPKIIMNGLTWNVNTYDNQLIVSRDDGLWKVDNDKASPVFKSLGFWTFKPISGSNPPKIACGNYFGIQLFSKEKGELKNDGSIRNFIESSRYMEVENNSIWVSHPYHGLYKINITDNSTKKYSLKDGLPSELDNHVFKIKNKIVIATTKGIYEIDPKSNKIIPSKYYQSILGNIPIRYLKEDLNGNIWFVQDKMLGIVDFKGTQAVVKYIPELFNHVLSGFENIYCYDSENTIIGSDIGFYNINYNKYSKQIFPYESYISSVKTFGNGDSILYGGFNNLLKDSNLKTSIPYKSNSIRFSFASSFLRHKSHIEFSYLLEGHDKKWSNWSSTPEKDYTNLKEGKYTFYLKSRHGPSNEFKQFSYSFEIKAPWYRNIWAYLLYLLITVSVIYTLLKLQKKKLQKKAQIRMQEAKLKFEEEQRQINYKHQLELEKNEKAIMQLTNDNLQAEIKHKSEDLASTAMNLLQKKAFLGKLTSHLNNLVLQNKDQVEASEIRKILRQIKSDEKLDEEWDKFTDHVKNVQSDFLNNLKKAYPDLNSKELKLCAYLRMNLSSKEMAQLFSISVRGVEISRYRLRKKLKLETHQDLFEFLINFESNGNKE